MKVYRGILLKESFHSNEFPALVMAYAIETYPYRLDGSIPVTVAKLIIPADVVQEVSWEVSENLLPARYYAHFACENDLIVSFPKMIVRVLRDQVKTFENARKVGRMFGIPDHQMKFELLFEQDHPKIRGEATVVREQPAVAITGGTKGIGLAVAYRMATKGYNLFLGYHRDDKAATAARNAIIEQNPNILIQLLKHDNNVQEGAELFFREAIAAFPNLTSFVHAAGVSKGDWNVWSQENQCLIPFLACPEQFVGLFSRQGNGHVILVSSTAAIRPFPRGKFYAAAKAAMDGYVRAVAVQSLSTIFINTVVPGIVSGGSDHPPNSVHTACTNQQHTQPDDIASIIVWLATENKVMTGQSLVVDGGLTVGVHPR